MKPLFPLTIFYDGACFVCGTEIDHYRRLDHGGRLLFIDISAADFEPHRHGRTQAQFQARMHVRDAAGHFYTGVDAFPVIWAALPNRGYRWLGRFIRLPGLHGAAACGYAVFARIRRYLPKRRCQTDRCTRH